MMHDPELLRRYVRDDDHAAFEELVRRHLDLVYSVALRQVGGDTHLAKDAAQVVFATLARKAASLLERPTLAGWLYRTAQFTAIDAVRGEQRRRMREREAFAMNETTSGGGQKGQEVEWERLRPLLDRAIGDLDDVDRDAVVMRFMQGNSFAEIGGRLRLTENAARMRVERALDKLHARLGSRGVRSTAAAIAMAVSAQAGTVAPAGLAATIASGAMIMSAATGAGAGVLTGIAVSKYVAIVAGAVAVASTGLLVMQRAELKETETALAVAQQGEHAFDEKMTALRVHATQAEERAAEAERDNGELLKAVEAARTQQAVAAAQAMGRAKENDERLARERAYQQELARLRAEEAKAQAKVSEEARKLGGREAYERLMTAAREHFVNARFRLGVRVFNEAMSIKPADVAVTPQVKELQAALAEQNVPVDLALSSDGETAVSIMGARSPIAFVATTVKILPGNYEIVGRRSGYADVVIPVQIRNGMTLTPITVVGTTRL